MVQALLFIIAKHKHANPDAGRCWASPTRALHGLKACRGQQTLLLRRKLSVSRTLFCPRHCPPHEQRFLCVSAIPLCSLLTLVCSPAKTGQRLAGQDSVGLCRLAGPCAGRASGRLALGRQAMPKLREKMIRFSRLCILIPPPPWP